MRRSVRLICWKLKRLRGRPDEIARGFAVGAFTGVMPLFGVQSMVAITLATLVRGNPLAAATTTWISNPITFIPLYTLNFRIGQQILGTQDLLLTLQDSPSLGQFFQMGLNCMATLTVGCLALGLLVALFSYLLGLWVARHWQWRRRQKYHRHDVRRYR